MSFKMKKPNIPVFRLVIFILLVLIMYMSTTLRVNMNIVEVVNRRVGNAAQAFQSAVDSKLRRRTLEDADDEKENNKNNLTLADLNGKPTIVPTPPATPPATLAAKMPPMLVPTPIPTSTAEATPALSISAPTLGERMKKLLKCNDRILNLEKVQYGEYWLLRNYVRGRNSTTVGCADTITLATNGEYPYFKYLPYLIERWQAPISFAIYAPGDDFESTMKSIQYARNCLPESELIRDYVTFHIFFPAKSMPIYIPLSEEEALLWPYGCESTPRYLSPRSSMKFRKLHNMTYPINVGRNIARKSVNTHFVFTSDIELYPSPNLAQNFLEIVERNRSLYLERTTERVFVLPVFEVQKGSSVPKNKTHLLQMIRERNAIPFHAMICKTCHLVPKYFDWIQASYSDELTLVSQSKREGRFGAWEPFYISDNTEPIFDERVTWEGQSNKRIQNYAMCLLNYDYFVLHPAFLVHTPGIKHYDPNSPRLRYVPAMDKLIDTVIKPEYKILYGTNNKCRI